MNKRANSTRANESPSRILEAALEPGQGVDESGEPRTEEQDKVLIKCVNASLLKTQAARRRGAVQLKPYKVDDTVRLINAKYLKASTRSNAMKMGPRWSRTIYEITKVRGTTVCHKAVVGTVVSNSMVSIGLVCIGPTLALYLRISPFNVIWHPLRLREHIPCHHLLCCSNCEV